MDSYPVTGREDYEEEMSKSRAKKSISESEEIQHLEAWVRSYAHTVADVLKSPDIADDVPGGTLTIWSQESNPEADAAINKWVNENPKEASELLKPWFGADLDVDTVDE